MADEPRLLAADDRANAYYAAVAEHLALTHGLDVPEWALDERRFLRKPFFPAELESLKATLLGVESPSAFRRRMIFVGADPLARPRRKRFAAPGGSGLRIFMPSPQYLFAMKCMAMRAEGLDGSHDIADSEALARQARIPRCRGTHSRSSRRSIRATIIPAKVRCGIEEIMERVAARKRRGK